MTLTEELSQVSTIFIDTAPIIYYIEAHPQFGPLIKEVVDFFQNEKIKAFSSVITLTELRALDAIQISAAMDIGADVFLTNDKKLKLIKELKVMVLRDYL